MVVSPSRAWFTIAKRLVIIAALGVEHSPAQLAVVDELQGAVEVLNGLRDSAAPPTPHGIDLLPRQRGHVGSGRRQ